jgi:hypothetical protein
MEKVIIMKMQKQSKPAHRRRDYYPTREVNGDGTSFLAHGPGPWAISNLAQYLKKLSLL